MLKLTRKVDEGNATASVTLPLDLRIKSRVKVTLDDGSEAGLFLPRGSILRGGDLVASLDGTVVEIRAAPESVSTVSCMDPHLLARACYHLGNRHVWVEVGDGCSEGARVMVPRFFRKQSWRLARLIIRFFEMWIFFVVLFIGLVSLFKEPS